MTDKHPATDLLKVEQIADELALNPQTIRNWIKSGELRAVRIGRGFRVKRGDLEEMLEGQAGKTISLGIHRDVWDPETLGSPYRREDGTSQQSIWDSTGDLIPSLKHD
jgi:excisionase family DNA binding protein